MDDYQNTNPQSEGAQNIGVTLPPKPEKKTGLAVASLILGIVSLVGLCCCGLNIITAPLAIIFGIISLAKKRDGTGLAITGIVLSALSLIMIIGVIFAFRDILPYSDTIMADYMQVITDQDEVFAKYEEDGTLPDYLKKYTEPPYSDFLAKYDADIYDVMDALLEQYKNGELAMPNGMSFEIPDELSGDLGDIEISDIDIPDIELDEAA